jgi:anaerobic selenocysteine-containing dehydrogenase
MAIREVKSFCRVCTSACGIVVEVEGEKVLRVRGDTEHALTAGYSCAKGRALPQAHHHPDRILAPRLRGGDGTPMVTGWDSALDDLAGKLSKIIAESGPRAIGVFLGGGGYMDAGGYLLARNLPGILGTPSVYSDMTVDVISKMLVSEMMAGVGGQMTRPDFERCRLVIYIGTNPLVSHGHTSMLASPSVRMREMMALGEVWVIDPRRSETAQRATRHLAPRPGSDYALLAFLIREILIEGADREYLAAHAQDLPRLQAAVQPFDAVQAASVTGLPEADLQRLLAAVRKAGRLTVETGTGISMSRAANVTQWLSWALMMVTGSMDREGGCWVNPGFLTQVDRLDIPLAPPPGWRGAGPESRPELLAVMGEYPCAAMADEIEAGHLRAMLNFGGNLVACLPETERSVAALQKLEVLASIDVIDNATTAISSHVLPAKDQLERPDLPYAVDIAYPWVATQYTPACVKPAGDVRAFWWILAQLGKRMGLEFLPGIEPDTATDDDILGRIADAGRQPLSEFQDGALAIAEPVAIGWLQKNADRMGGWRLAPVELVAQLAEMEPPAPLVLIPRRQPYHINSRFLELRDTPAIWVNAEDAAKAGLRDGDDSIVRSAHGTLAGRLRIDPRLRPGVMSIPHGWSSAFNVNRLTGTRDVDPLTGMPRYSGLAVTLHRAADGAAGPAAAKASATL